MLRICGKVMLTSLQSPLWQGDRWVTPFSFCGVLAVATLSHPMEMSFGVIVPRFEVGSGGDVRHIGRCPTVSLIVGVRVQSPSHSMGQGSPPRAVRKSQPQHREARPTAFDRPPNAIREGLRNDLLPTEVETGWSLGARPQLGSGSPVSSREGLNP